MDLLAWASDPILRHNGSSGGFIRAMTLHLLETGKIDQMLLTRTGPREGPFMPDCVATNDVLEITSERSTSVYYPTDPFFNVLDPNLTYAITLLPCQVETLRKKQTRGEWLNVFYVFELLCGFMPTPNWTLKLCDDFQAVNPSRLVYREGKWPGNFSIDGRSTEYPKLWPKIGEYGMPKCQKCTRLYGESDWLCADPWGLPPEEVGEGKTLVRANTLQARILINEARLGQVIQTEPDNSLLQVRLKKHRRTKCLNQS